MYDNLFHSDPQQISCQTQDRRMGILTLLLLLYNIPFDL